MSLIYNYYYMASSGELEQGISSPVVLTFSKLKNGPTGEVKPHKHPYMEIFYFDEGKGFFECVGEKQEIEAGDVVIVSAGKTHLQYSSEVTPLTFYGFAVTNVKVPFAERPDSLSNKGYAVIRKAKEVKGIIDDIMRELEDDKTGAMVSAMAHFRLLLVSIIRQINVMPKSDKMTLAEEVRTYIEMHCDEDITLDGLCKQFFVGKSHLLHSFKRDEGTSPMRYLNSYRIEKAKELLKSGERVTAVALSVGFSNPVYFSELFRRQVGITPSAFKKFSSKIGEEQ